MVINVTDTHIQAGTRADCSRCPVALAIKDAGYDLKAVHFYTLRVKNKEYFLPPKVTKFIREFDFGFPVKPITFELGIKP